MEDPYKGSGSNYTSGQAPAISGGQPVISGPNVPLTAAAPSGGDVILTGNITPKNKNNKIIIIILVLTIVAAVAIAVAAVIMPKLSLGSNPEIKTRFSELYDYAHDIKENMDASEELSTDDDIEERQDSFAELYSRYEAFADVWNKNKGQSLVDMQSSVDKLDSTMLLVRGIASPEEVAEEFLGVYRNDGEKAVISAIDQIGASTGESAELSFVADIEKDYYMTLMDVYMMYEDVGCIIDGELDSDCAAEQYDTFDLNLMDVYTINEEVKLQKPVVFSSALNGVLKKLDEINDMFERRA